MTSQVIRFSLGTRLYLVTAPAASGQMRRIVWELLLQNNHVIYSDSTNSSIFKNKHLVGHHQYSPCG